MLGPLEVLENGQALDVGGSKQRALLAVLLLNANHVVSRDRLIDALWDEHPPESAHKALQVYVSQLRRVFGKERLVTKAPGYLLRVDPEEVDLVRFEAQIEQAKVAGPDAAAAKLREALALWRGAPLAEFAYHGFAQSEIARLEELRVACLEERIETDLGRGRHAELVGELEGLVKEYPLRERLRSQLMISLYRSGRQAEALEAYQAARAALVEELGIQPSKSLRELEQAILRQDPALELSSVSAEAAEATEAARGIFVGRESELAELRAGLDSAIAGRGSLFLLVGEPGIGKSRLAEEIVRQARARRARLLVGRCWEAGGAPAYWPWVQSLRTYIEQREPTTLRTELGTGAAELAQIIPELRELFPDLPGPSPESEGARFRLFDSATRFLKNAAAVQPLLLVLDDLHAADEPSLLLLQFLAGELSSSRILVVGTYRDVDPTVRDPLASTLAELAREQVTHRLELAGLATADVARYIELTAGRTPAAELVATIHAETEGNPLFVGEIVRLLAPEGRLPEIDVPALWTLGIPQGVREVIGRRLRRLSADCTRVLTLAAVLGREFALDALARLTDLREDELFDVLDEALTARVLSSAPGARDRLRFAHALIRETLYDELTTPRRVQLHRRAAQALEALYARDPEPHLAELAHHAIAGSDFRDGMRYARRAGDHALALLAYEEAARLYETALEALDLLGPSDERTRCELLLSFGEAEGRAGNSPAAKEAFLAAAEIARRLGLASEVARAAAGYGGRIVWARAGGDDRLVPLLEEGLAALGDDDVELRAKTLARLAGALRDEHSRDRRDRLSKEAVELARASENPTALASALDGRLAAIQAPDTVAECVALATEALELAERIGDRERVVHALVWRFVARLETSDDFGTDLASAVPIAEELRQPAQLFMVTSSRAMLALTTGDFAAAEKLVHETFALGERTQSNAAIPIDRLQRYTLCELRGTLEEVEPEIRDLVADYPARPAFRCVLAHLYARLGRLGDARREFEDFARGNFSGLPFDMEWLYGMSLLAETCALLDDIDSAAVLYRLLLPYAGFNAIDQPEGMRGSVSRYLGVLAATMSRWDEAARHFEDALKRNASMGARPWLAHTQHDYARMLLARRAGGDIEKAQQLLTDALTTYRELGMQAAAERA
jgi:DNA-binding SARP family transcriptional activator/tetratricopeptide (TPR) repeat protein